MDWVCSLKKLVFAVFLLALGGCCQQGAQSNFCKTVLAEADNRAFLKSFYEEDYKFEGESVELGRDTDLYRTYLACTEASTKEGCWLALINANAVTNREVVERYLAVGTVLHDCSVSDGGLDKSPQRKTEVQVVYAKAASEQYAGMVVNTETIELLEKHYREKMFANQARMLQGQGYTTEALSKVTGVSHVTVDSFDMPVGVASVWLSNKTAEGEMRSKYIYVAGIKEDTLHMVICTQVEGDDLALMAEPKCFDKLTEVFSGQS